MMPMKEFSDLHGSDPKVEDIWAVVDKNVPIAWQEIRQIIETIPTKPRFLQIIGDMRSGLIYSREKSEESTRILIGEFTDAIFVYSLVRGISAFGKQHPNYALNNRLVEEIADAIPKLTEKETRINLTRDRKFKLVFAKYPDGQITLEVESFA